MKIENTWGLNRKIFFKKEKNRANVSNCIWSLYDSLNNRLNLEYLRNYILEGPSPSIQTPFNNIFQVPSGATLSSNGILDSSSIPRKVKTNKDTLEKDIINSICKNIDKIIKLYKNTKSLIVLLSGGLDSTLLLNLINKTSNLPIIAVNIYFRDCKSTDERYFANIAVGKKEVNLLDIEIDTFSFLEYDDLSCKAEIPSRELLFGFVWNKIRNNIPHPKNTLVFSGHGGDQLFDIPYVYKSKFNFMDIIHICKIEKKSFWEVFYNFIKSRLSSNLLNEKIGFDKHINEWWKKIVYDQRKINKYIMYTTLWSTCWNEEAYDYFLSPVIYPLLNMETICLIISSLWECNDFFYDRELERKILKYLGVSDKIYLRKSKGSVLEPLLKYCSKNNLKLIEYCKTVMNKNIFSKERIKEIEYKTANWTKDSNLVWNLISVEKWLKRL